MKAWMKQSRTLKAGEIMFKLAHKLHGYYRYYGITDNVSRLQEFFNAARRQLFKWLNRRSQKRSLDGPMFERLLARYQLPKPKIQQNIMDIRLPSAYLP